MSNEDLADIIGRSIKMIAHAITPLDAKPCTDVHGGFIISLTESVVSVSVSLNSIAEAIERLAKAVEDHTSDTLDRLDREDQ